MNVDIKGDLMEKVSYALIRKIGEIESSKIVDIQQKLDSKTLASETFKVE